jgi:hypothetical protein
MSLRVFNADLNPQVDDFSYKCSDSSAQAAVDAGRGQFIILPCGRRALQMFPPKEFIPLTFDAEGKSILERLAGNFRDAWGQKPSDGIPVWQLRT